MLIVALSGGIASGKTLVSDQFARRGFEVIDTDIIARQIVDLDSEGLAKITQHFGKKIISESGDLDRLALREIVFSEPTQLKALEAITHPLIRQQVLDNIKHCQGDVAILVVPLLFESLAHYQFVDRILICDCPVERQIARLLARDQCSTAQAQAIIKRQATREQRLSIADDVINTDVSFGDITTRLSHLHSDYLRLAAPIS